MTSRNREECAVSSHNWIEDLPVAAPPADRWQISLRELSILIEEGEHGPWHPRLLLVVEGGTGAVLGHRLLEPDADPDLVLDLLYTTLSEPATGAPRRPAHIQTDTDSLVPPLSELTAQMGMKLERLPDLPELSFAIHSFEEFMTPHPELYLASEQSDPAVIADFFNAAAAYYRAAPWKRLTDAEPLTLQVDGWDEPRYVVLMGHGGIVRGLVLYDDWEDLEDLYTDEEINPLELSCTGFFFTDKKDLAEEARLEIAENGWNVVSYKAYPVATRTDATGPPRVPTMEQIRELTLALYIVINYVAGLPRGRTARRAWGRFTLETPNGDVEGVIGYGIFFEDDTLDEEDETDE